MSEINQEKRIYFEHLDVIRFIAAFYVVVAHAYEGWNGWYARNLYILTDSTGSELSTFGRFANKFIRNGGIGVDIFFLLSGFLITYILLEEKKRYNKIAIGKFMIRRSLRIWPLYYLLIVMSPFLVSWYGSTPPNYLANALFLGNFNTIITESWDFPFAHFWSICIEEHFYLIWPFIIAFIPKKYLLATFSTIIFASIFFRIYCAMTLPYPFFTYYLHTLSKIDVLVIGAVGAYYYSIKPFEIKLSRYIRFLLYAILIIALSVESTHPEANIIGFGFRKYIYIALFAILILDYNFNPNFKHLLPRRSIIHYFGKVSYGIYMYSNILIGIIVTKMMYPWGLSSPWIYFGLNIGLSIIIPIISYELYEKHFLKLSKRFRVIKTSR